MSVATVVEPETTSLWSRLPVAVQVIAALVVAIWAVEIADRILFGVSLQSHGVGPRSLDGLDGVALAPVLHGGWWHLVSNTFPLVVLGSLVAVRGTRYLVSTLAIVWVLGGLGTWLIGESGSNHIGASGLVFGLFGSLIGAAVFERRIAAGATALVAVMLYGGIIDGLAPQPGVSWEGHLAGLLAGVVAARVLSQPRPQSALYEPPLSDPYWEV